MANLLLVVKTAYQHFKQCYIIHFPVAIMVHGVIKTDLGSFIEILTKILHKFNVSYRVITFGSNYLKVQNYLKIAERWKIQTTTLVKGK